MPANKLEKGHEVKWGVGLEGRGNTVALSSVTDFLVCLLPWHLTSPSFNAACQR